MMEDLHRMFDRMRPFMGVIFLQFGYAGMDILSKVALDHGISNYVLVVYRHAVATLVIAPFALILDKKIRPKMTLSIFTKIMVLSLLEPVIDQNLYYLGMKYTTATFAAAMYNVLPAITFLIAWILRLEKVKITSVRTQAKIGGIVATVAGAMVMTVAKGPALGLPWTKGRKNQEQINAANLQNFIKGSIMITIGCLSWACFMILQAITLRTYPAELSLTVWICLLGTMEGTIVALAMERGKAGIWSLKWDTKLIAALYSGIVCSGLAYYIQGVIMKDRGPVFVTAFNPLSMVIVAVLSSFILGEQMFLGRVIGAIVIVAGLFLLVWGKSKDYKSASEFIAPATQRNITDSSKEEICNNEVISINDSGEGIETRDEKNTQKKSSFCLNYSSPKGHPLQL